MPNLARRRAGAMPSVAAALATGAALAGMVAAAPATASPDSDGGPGAARASEGAGDRADRRGDAGGETPPAARRVKSGAQTGESTSPPEECRHRWFYPVPLPTAAVNVNRGLFFGAIAGLGTSPLVTPPAVVQGGARAASTAAAPETSAVLASASSGTAEASAASPVFSPVFPPPTGMPTGGPFMPVPPPTPPAPPQAAPPPRPATALPAATPPRPPLPSRLGYPEYLRAASVAEVAALALSGLAGLAALTGLGGLIGYRQAKAGFAMPASGVGRFLP